MNDQSTGISSHCLMVLLHIPLFFQDWHWMFYKDGTCSFDDMKEHFSIERHALQMHIPTREDGTIDCEENGQRKFPRLDYSKGFPDFWYLARVAVTTPSQHWQENYQYAAELTLDHFYMIPHSKNEVGSYWNTLQCLLKSRSPNTDFIHLLWCRWAPSRSLCKTIRTQSLGLGLTSSFVNGEKRKRKLAKHVIYLQLLPTEDAAFFVVKRLQRSIPRLLLHQHLGQLHNRPTPQSHRRPQINLQLNQAVPLAQIQALLLPLPLPCRPKIPLSSPPNRSNRLPLRLQAICPLRLLQRVASPVHLLQRL